MRARIGPAYLALVTIVCALVLGSTASADSIGPANEPHFEEVARRSLDLGDEPILLFGRANWLFGVDEFKWGRAGTMLPDAGVLILLKNQLVFAVWDKVKDGYVRHLQIPYEDIAEVRQRVWGLNQRIVVLTKRDTLHAFAYASSGGATINTGRTVNGLRILRKETGLGPPE